MDTTTPTSQSGFTDAYSGESSPTRRRMMTTMSTNYSSSEPNQDQWHKLDDVLIETILALLPIADFFRCQFVCKRWMFLVHSPTFTNICQELFVHKPWFYMLDEENPADFVYDMEINDWRHARLPLPTNICGKQSIPVAASGSLMCFRSETGSLVVCNPLTGSARLIAWLNSDLKIKVITMHAWGSNYNVFLLSGKSSNITLQMFSSESDTWIEMRLLDIFAFRNRFRAINQEGEGEMQQPMPRVVKWNPMKELTGVTVVGHFGQAIVYYLNHRGRLIGCDTLNGTVLKYPRLFPTRVEHAIDLVECEGRVLVVALRDALGAARLQVWEFDHLRWKWKCVAAMPLDMSQSFYGLKANINCAGHGVYVMVCVNSNSSIFNQVVMCDVTKNYWVNLPACIDHRSGDVKRFVSTYSFMPDIKVNA